MSQSDFFLKIDGIDGESTDDKHKGELEIQSWSWGATNQGTFGAGGGGGAGKADFSDITITKFADKSTPKLLKAVATGQHIKSMILVCRKAGGDKQEYLKLTLTDVLISSYHSSASGGSSPVPSEAIALNYAVINYEYKPQKADGSLEGSVAVSYDRHANKAT
ncbi:MAG: type VI secretion system tube protein Hcp [Rhodanobacter sp.]